MKPVETPPVTQPKQSAPDHFATCQEATEKVPGYTFVREALQRCPDLQALQRDPNAKMTFFVPNDKVSEYTCSWAAAACDLL